MSYVHLFKPYAFQPGQEEKYSVTVLVPKSDADTMARINAAIETAIQKGVQDRWGGVRPPVLPTPVYDGDGVRPSDGMAFGPECKGCWVFTASSKTDYPPEVVDSMGNPIINQSEIYSGIYGRVNISFYPYAFGGKKGIGCGLGPVQKLEDGEPLGGSAPAASQVFGTPQPATPAYGAAMPATSGANGYTPVPQPSYGGAVQQPYAAPYGGQPAAGGINPITGLPF